MSKIFNKNPRDFKVELLKGVVNENYMNNVCYFQIKSIYIRYKIDSGQLHSWNPVHSRWARIDEEESTFPLH